MTGFLLSVDPGLRSLLLKSGVEMGEIDEVDFSPGRALFTF